jgi:hypothetical protein
MNWLPARASRTAGRRKLTFASLGEVMPDVKRLLAGHTVVGRWTLAQVCNHLATTIGFSLDGVPRKAPWLVRRTAGVFFRLLVLGRGWFPEGVTVPAVFLPQAVLEAADEVRALRDAIERFLSYRGELDEHPLLGRLSPGQWERFHCLHCAHHLSFAVPSLP